MLSPPLSHHHPTCCNPQRLAERDAAKAAEAAEAPAAPAAESARGAAPDASPVPSAPHSRLGSPKTKRSSSRAPASVVSMCFASHLPLP